MSNETTDTFSILLEPHELADIRACIFQKLHAQKGTYLHEKQYYLDEVLHLVAVEPCGMISRTNHLISFQVSARVSFVRPRVGDLVTGTVSSIIKHGTFVQTKLFTSIVPTQLDAQPPIGVSLGDTVTVRIEDVKFSAKHIYTISSFVSVDATPVASTTTGAS
jgi:hypothetical protein